MPQNLTFSMIRLYIHWPTWTCHVGAGWSWTSTQGRCTFWCLQLSSEQFEELMHVLLAHNPHQRVVMHWSLCCIFQYETWHLWCVFGWAVCTTLFMVHRRTGTPSTAQCLFTATARRLLHWYNAWCQCDCPQASPRYVHICPSTPLGLFQSNVLHSSISGDVLGCFSSALFCWCLVCAWCFCAAEGLQFGNSVYEIRFDDHFRDKVDHKALSEPYKLLFLCVTFVWGRRWFSYLLSQESSCGIAALSLITAIWDSVWVPFAGVSLLPFFNLS
jgi:hypothetical protein